jgi:glycosyltransferase involved in cell wall biosynthesis
MRILLVGNYALDDQASMLRYAEMLRRQMAERGHVVEVIQPKAVVGDWVGQPLLRKWLGYFDKYVLFPWRLRLRARDFDLVHVCDHSNSMYLAHTGGRPASITCHDLLAIGSALGRYPQQKVGLAGRAQQRWILRHLAEADDLVCVSTNTANELGSLTRRDGQRVVVIANAVDEGCAPASEESVLRVRKQLGVAADERYLFHVGGNQWYKNRLGVLRIFKLVRERLGEGSGLRLVMAGAAFSQEMRDYVAANLPEGSVVEALNPTDGDLWALYTGAAALLFPSLHEGFGWPLVEAQCCGCPVIASNRPPMTEVAGAAALYIDPEDEPGAAAAVAEKLGGLGELRQAGFENVKRFDADAIASEYENFFAGVLRLRRSTDSGVGGR